MDYTEETLRRINRYQGIIVDVRVDQVRLADGKVTFREVVQHPGGVCVLPVDDKGVAYCVRQYRYPAGEHLLEVPAGKLEPGEDPRECAIRELGEETGFTAGEMISLGSFYTSPGFSTEKLHLFLATGLKNGQAHPDEGEFLDLVRIPLGALADMASRG